MRTFSPCSILKGAVFGLLATTALLAAAPAGAQHPPASNIPSAPETARMKALVPAPQHKQLTLICTLDRPSQVQRYFVTCNPGTTQLDVAVADCCIPGDHWQAKVKVWDAAPNTAVESSPGPANVFSPAGRVYNYGGTAFNKDLKALIECSYLDGVDVFGAGSFITVTSNGTCTSMDLGKEDRIDRTP